MNRHLLSSIFYLLCAFSAFGTDMAIQLNRAADGGAVANRKLIITRLDVDSAGGGIAPGDTTVTNTDANGFVVVSNMAAGNYTLEITAPPNRKIYCFNVDGAAGLEYLTNHTILFPERIYPPGFTTYSMQAIDSKLANLVINGGGGSGNVTGPVSSQLHHLAAFANTQGSSLEDSGIAFSTVALTAWLQATNSAIQSQLQSSNAAYQAQFAASNTVYRAAFDPNGAGVAAATAATNAQAAIILNKAPTNSPTIFTPTFSGGASVNGGNLQLDNGQRKIRSGDVNLSGEEEGYIQFAAPSPGTPTMTISAGENNNLFVTSDSDITFNTSVGVFIQGGGSFNGSGSGLTNLNPAIATNNASASDGWVLSRTGNNLKLIPASGAGTVTSVALSMPGEFTVSGSPITGSGAFSVTRAADANFLGFGGTNVGFWKVGGTLAGDTMITTNGMTNLSLTASTLLKADANKKVTSFANGAGVLTNDAGGNFGYAPMLSASSLGANHHVGTDANTNLINQEDATGYTNTVSYSHQGTATNITVTFNGTIQTYTITNGPDVWLHVQGANGSASFRIYSTNFTTLHFDNQPKWLFGSNNVITNGVLNLSSYGGTNTAVPSQLEAAMKENQ